MTVALLALGLSVAALVGLVLRRAGRADARRRAGRLDACATLLDGCVRSLDPSGDPVLRGRRGPSEAALRVFSEQLAFRRLPQLWLAATIRCDLQTAATLDIVRRPTGAEFFSAAETLPERHAPPAGWPRDTRICGSSGSAATLAALAAHLTEPLADPRIKAALVTPRGVRVIRQAAQGRRGAYLLFRDSRFPCVRIPPDEAAAAFDLARRIAAALTQPPREAHERPRRDISQAA